jgi:ABC-2 type transport system ATP-binding protein
MSTILSIQNISKKFGDVVALNDVTFTISQGEIVTLIVPNSAGKSTLVKCVVGLLQQDTGTIEILGSDTVKDPSKSKSLVGYIPDEPSVWQTMTGEEFLYFTQALFNVDEKQRSKKNRELLPIFSLEGIEKKAFEEYSRGNRQKFSILAALSHQPKLLVVDEPIVGLDPLGAEIAKDLFKKHANDGGAVLLVTHTLSVAEEISDKIGFIRNGKLAAFGTLDELRVKAGLTSSDSLMSVYKKLAE